MNRDYYNNLSEAYKQVDEEQRKKGGHDYSNVLKTAKKVADETGYAAKAYGKGLFTGKKVGSKDPMTDRAANAVGRAGSVVGKTVANNAKNVFNAGKKVYQGAYNYAKDSIEKTRGGLSKEEFEALLNSPHLTEEEREAFIALIDEERKDEAGMTPDQKSIGRSIKAGLNPTTDHMAAATRQRLHLSQRGKKKPTAHSKETRLPAQQLKARKANDGVKEMGEETIHENEAVETAKDFAHGLVKGKGINSKAPTHARAANAVGRGLNKIASRPLKTADKIGASAIRTGARIGKGVADTVNDVTRPYRMDRSGSEVQNYDSYKKLEKADANKTSRSVYGEEFDLDRVLDAMCEGLPEPKVNYLKDMDPYDPRRAIRQHAPGSPLPPPRPGIPDFFKKAKKDDKKKDTKTA